MAKHLSNAPVIVINENNPKRKNPLVWVMVLAFAAVLGVGGTFALFTYTTNQAVNDLSTVTNGVTADVLEAKWDETTAENMVPGQVVDKDPVIVNTSTSGLSEYVGMKLTFEKSTDGGNTYAAFTQADMNNFWVIYTLSYADTTSATTAGAAFNTTDWAQISPTGAADNELYFIYNSSITAMDSSTTSDDDITAANKTTELFKYVRLVDTTTQAQLSDFNITDWRITVSGAAIQSDNVASADAYGADNWKSLLDAAAQTSDKSGVRNNY